MTDDLKRNIEGYYDPTAYKAIKNYMKNEENNMEIYAGDIFEAEKNNGYTMEVVILSVHEIFSTCLMLTDNDSLPYSIKCQGIKYTDTGMLQYIFNDKLKDLIRSMKKDELDDLMKAVIDDLGYSAPSKTIAEIKPVIEPVVHVSSSEELLKAQAERDVYKSLYENLISGMMAK